MLYLPASGSSLCDRAPVWLVISAHFSLSFCMVVSGTHQALSALPRLWVAMGFHCVWIHTLLFPPGSWGDRILAFPGLSEFPPPSPRPSSSVARKASNAVLREQATEEVLSGLFQTCRCTVNTHQEVRLTREPRLLHWLIFSKKTSR